MTNDEAKQLSIRLKKDLGKIIDKTINEMLKRNNHLYGEESLLIPKKKATDPMSTDEFITGCAKDSQRHIQIIGDYADQLKDMDLLNGGYTNRGEWDGFLKRNLKVAMKIKPYKDSLITYAMVEVKKSLRKNGGYMDRFTLETVYRFLVK